MPEELREKTVAGSVEPIVTLRRKEKIPAAVQIIQTPLYAEDRFVQIEEILGEIVPDVLRTLELFVGTPHAIKSSRRHLA